MGTFTAPNLGVIQRTITNCLSFYNHGVDGEIGMDQSEAECMAWIVNNVCIIMKIQDFIMMSMV